MEFTGERFVPGTAGRMKLEHLQRYALCRGLVRGKRVLDIATGEGYGAAMLCGSASRVIGVDVAADAILHARAKYRAANVHFVVGACEAIPLAAGSIDVIVSFETIEHLVDHDAMMREFRRVLAPGGLAIISSPEKHTYAERKTPNPFHRRELTLAEFEALVRAHFSAVRLWGQRVAVGSFSYPLGAPASAGTTFAAMTIVGDELQDAVGVLPSPEYCLALCANGDLPDVRLDSVSLEPDDDFYATLAKSIRAYDATVQGMSKEMLAVRESFGTQLAAKDTQIAGQQALVEIVYRSRSWQLTAPLRDARRMAGRMRHVAATRVERVLRSAYRRLPVASQHRWRIKSAVFRRTGWLMRGTASYQHWEGTERRALRHSGARLLAPLRSQAATPGQIRLPCADEPIVSVIIPVYGQTECTRRCLASIAQHAPKTPIEVIVVDDASPELAADALGQVEGLLIVRNDRNEGFIRSSNRGAREARGRFLLFLNNDTEVLPGWCDELAATFDTVPEAGIVGAKLLYPDGTLQEAGGVVWRDGSAWNYGKFDDPAKPEYSYRREVDYVSGAALMVPRDLFWEVGGFDEHYLPAYYEDVDLALAVREAGRSVLFQPLSQIVHHEGATSGTDLTRGVKAWQLENSKKLATRWRQQLSTQFEPGQSIFQARERGVGIRVLVLDHCTPEPDKDAGSFVVFAIMQVLQSLGCKITFVPEDNYLFLERYTPDLQRLGIECLYAPFVTSVQQYLEEHGDAFDLIVIFRFTAASRSLEAIRRLAPRAKVILDPVDLHFLREGREADLRDDAGMRQRAEKTRRAELDIIGRVDCTVVHSTVEQELLAREKPDARVKVFTWALDAPGTEIPYGPRRDIAFIGGYQHPPNADAAHYFATDIFPLVRRHISGVRFQIVGSNPTAALRKLQSDSIDVPGFIPDLSKHLDGLRLTVAPLRYGAGIKGKIVTSLSHGVPCVVTPLGAEGMGLEHERNVLIAESPEEFAAAVVRLYQDGALWQSLSASGLKFVRETYSFDGATRLFTDILRGIGLEPVARHRACRQRDGLEIVELSNAAADRAHRAQARDRFAERALIERALIPDNEAPFRVDGFCIGCQRPQEFTVGFDFAVRDEQGTRVPNWREHLVCECGLNARTRAAIHVLTMKLRVPRTARIYLMEQQSLLYEWLKQRHPNLVGSEFVGDMAALGASWRGIRNEDATRLTFSDGSFDYVLSFDVLEHVPKYERAFREAHRCLTDGGTFLFTAPFVRNSETTIERARVSDSGEIQHLLEPEYHGDPMNPEGGILCFQHFGWDIIDKLKAVGFADARGHFLWSRRLGYLGGEQALFTATK
jgi:GT2 family glycosyltransferase/ubiquinone/menaquinone biosynthesis C-methylase UbiE/glycosyltransferase involved in cell wall biosynthesis